MICKFWYSINCLTSSFQANGGAGDSSNIGGGSGGRLAVYYQEEDWWFGSLQAFGGSASYGPGGAGTVFLEVNFIPALSTSMLQVAEFLSGFLPIL